jgi:hypothetical protein
MLMILPRIPVEIVWRMEVL